MDHSRDLSLVRVRQHPELSLQLFHLVVEVKKDTSSFAFTLHELIHKAQLNGPILSASERVGGLVQEVALLVT